MTNFEYYAEQIKAINYDFAYVDGKITKCSIDVCDEECKYFKDDCTATKVKWLYEEHKEHKEQPKLTQNERKLCEIMKDGFLKRNQYGTLVWLAEKDSIANWVLCVPPLRYCDFQFIKYEEMWAMSDLLKLEVME